jgi:hypothetical protein
MSWKGPQSAAGPTCFDRLSTHWIMDDAANDSAGSVDLDNLSGVANRV